MAFHECDDVCSCNNFDIISALPVEISTMIFQMLNLTAMHAAMTVRKSWYRIYQSNRGALERIFKQKVQRLRRQRLHLAKYLTTRKAANLKQHATQPMKDKKRKRANRIEESPYEKKSKYNNGGTSYSTDYTDGRKLMRM